MLNFSWRSLLKNTVVTTAQLLQFVAHSSIIFDPVYLSKKKKESNRPPVKTNLKQGAHIHQPKARLVPHAFAQPYHPGSDSHRQLFRPYWGSSAWHSRRVHERGKSPCIKDPLLPRRVQSTPVSASSTQHMWELLAGNCTALLAQHAREGGSGVTLICVPVAASGKRN